MAILRVIIVQVNSGAAQSIGGPVHTTYKTFDVPCPPEIQRALRTDRWTEASIEGVALVDDEPEDARD